LRAAWAKTILDGGEGSDTTDYSAATAAVQVSLATGSSTGAAGADVLRSIENVTGSGFADRLDGGGGVDTALYGDSAAVSISLIAGTATGGDAQGDVLLGIENLVGGAGADSLAGDTAANLLAGGLGADYLSGGEDADAMHALGVARPRPRRPSQRGDYPAHRRVAAGGQ